MFNKYLWIKFSTVIAVLIFVFVNGLWFVPVFSAGSDSVESKISSLLSLHVKLKQSRSTGSPEILMPLFGSEPQSSGETTFVEKERVFLHFAQQPTSAQVEEIVSLGVTLYPESWIPPLNSYKTGFVLADMPVNKLNPLAAKDYILALDTAEQILSPQNDSARKAMNVGPVWDEGYTGAGVTVAVIDSGLDTSNPDFPAPLAAIDYSNYPVKDATIANTVTGHGTHVTASLLGRGINSATYKGVAPDAGLVFIKIGNDTDGSASSSAAAYAIRDAVDIYHAKIISFSYGTWSEYHDGTDQTCQTIDYATSQGATVFTSAGNKAGKQWHFTGVVEAAGTTIEIPVKVASDTSYLAMNLVWFDGISTHNSLNLQYYDPKLQSLSPLSGEQSESARGTESKPYHMGTAVTPGVYYLKVQNSSSNDQVFHIYYMGGADSVTFNDADRWFTVDSPAEADSAIAVGATVSREHWTNYQGKFYYVSSGSIGSPTAYSANGPRVDANAPEKPDLVAPGRVVISARDPFYSPGNANYDPLIIDDDGQNLNGSGPANYIAMEGTSAAAPMAAGAGALLLSKNPSLLPAQIRHNLEVTASKTDTGRLPAWGWGLINAQKALNNVTTLDSYSDAEMDQACNDFDGGTELNNVYMYFSGTGYLFDHIYKIACYDGANNLLTVTNAVTFGNMFSAAFKINHDGTAGTWHVVVSEPEFTPPVTYNKAWAYTIVSDSFNVRLSPKGSPMVFTREASDIGDIFATLNGELSDLGTGPSLQVSFEYGLDSTYSDATGLLDQSSTGTFSIQISDLVPDRVYHFRAKADGGNGKISYGIDISFNTLPSQLTGKIAFSSNGSIFTMNLHSGDITTLTDGNGTFDWGPVWSPDGSKIAFIRNNTKIMIMDNDGTNQNLVRDCDLRSGLPSWSPDGKKLIFSERIDASSSYSAICTVDIDGTGWQELASDHTWGYTQPCWSPDGTKIAFTAMYAPEGIGGFQVFTIDTDGTHQTKVTDTANSQNLFPAWSPDGSKIAYGAGQEIRIVNNDGTNNINITGSTGLNGFPSWSPDGTKIVYVSDRDGNMNHLYIMGVNGYSDIQITDDSYSACYPSWTEHINPEPVALTSFASDISGSSARLNGYIAGLGDALSVKIYFQWGTISGQYSLETPLQEITGPGYFGYEIFGLTQGTTYYYRFKAIGNGTRYGDEFVFTTLDYTGLTGKIVFSAYRFVGTEVFIDIYLMNPDGSQRKRLTYDNSRNGQPVLSPDGSKIAFLSVKDKTESRIYVMNSDGTNQLKLTDIDAMNYRPSWSPDGAQIAYTAKVDNHDQIFIMNADGTNPQQLTHNISFNDGNPTWSPDGTKIAFESTQTGNSYQQIYLINCDSTNLQRLTHISKNCNHPVWSPDGSKIAYLADWGTAEGWVWQQIQYIDLDTNQTSTVYDRVTCGYPISWSPDSTKLAFTSSYIDYSISTISLDGTNLIRLSTGNSTDFAPSWSEGFWKAPVVETGTASTLFTDVLITGILSDPGTAGSVLLSFDWYSDDHSSGGSVAGTPASLASTGTFEARLTGLADGQTYHYRAKAVGDGTSYGEEKTFVYYAPRLVFTSSPQDLTAGSVSGIITIQLQDIDGNPVNAVSGLDISLASDSPSGKFDTQENGDFDGTITRISMPSGSDSAHFYYRDTLSGSPTLLLSCEGPINGAQRVSINTAAAYQIRLETQADGSGAPVPSQYLVTGNSLTMYSIVRDRFDNFISNETVSWSLINKTGGAANSDLAPSQDGRSAGYYGKAMGTAVVHIELDGLESSDTVIITVIPKLNITPIASATIAGSINTFTLTASNFGGIIETEYAGTVHFTSTDAQADLPADYTFQSEDQGVHQFTVEFRTAGTQSIRVADIAADVINVTQSGILVNAAEASRIGVETAGNGTGAILPGRDIASGSSVRGYTVTRDRFGNFVASAAASWSLVERTGGVSSSDLIPSEDGKSAIFTGHIIGDSRIRVILSGLDSVDSGILTVSAGRPSKLQISGYPSIINTIDYADFIITVQDESGNTAPDYTGTIHFTFNAGYAYLPGNYTFKMADNGTHTFSAAFTYLGYQSFTAVDTQMGNMFATQSAVVTHHVVFSITTYSLPDAEIGQPYSQPLVAIGGAAPYSWSVTGSLPGGLLCTGNTITGTPTGTLKAAKTSQFLVKVTDGNSLVDTRMLTITVHPQLAIITTSLNKGFKDTPYSQVLTAKGGSGYYSWSTAGPVPAGLSVYGNSIKGTPTQAGTYSFSLKVDDGIGQTVSPKLLTLNIYEPLEITNTALPDGDVKTAYTVILEAKGGAGPYTWSKKGTWPAGLNLTSRGVIRGKPTVAGDFNDLYVQVKDNQKNVTSTLLSIHINPAVTLKADPLPPGEKNLVYTTWAPSASGGNGQYTWSHTGKLPAGLSFDVDTGTISGTPLADVNKAAITVKVSDTLGGSDNKKLSLKINKPVIISTTSLKKVKAGSDYNAKLTAKYGSGKYTWALTEGSNPLPDWASLNSLTGAITTRPDNETMAGTWSFTILVTDTLGGTATGYFTLTVE